jgi:hypothetical protein
MSTVRKRHDYALWLQASCTLLVALGAAYASYRHGHAFALRFGADPVTAAIWPLIVDGLLMIATVELWKNSAYPSRPANGPSAGPGGSPASTASDRKWAAWLSFLFGIALSLCANIASAPHLDTLTVAVAACPPLALLLSVELLNRALSGAEPRSQACRPRRRLRHPPPLARQPARLDVPAPTPCPRRSGRPPRSLRTERTPTGRSFGHLR